MGKCSEEFVPLDQRGLVVEAPGGLVLSERHSAQLVKFLYALDLRELYKMWYKKKGRVIEKELVNKAKAQAVSDTLRRKCNEARFQAILRRAFQDEEEEDDDALLVHCKAVLESMKEPQAYSVTCGQTHGDLGTPDAFIEVHRVICEANAGAHSLDVAALRQLASDGPGGAKELAEGIGHANVAPLVKTMAKSLL